MTTSQDDPCGPDKFLAPTRSINIRTAAPGPKSRAFLHRFPPAARQDSEIVLASAHGARVIDVDNNVYLDFVSGTALGHTHERVVAAVQRQAELADVPLEGMVHPLEVELDALLAAFIPHLASRQRWLGTPSAIAAVLPSYDPADRAGAAICDFANTAHLWHADQFSGTQPALLIVNITPAVTMLLAERTLDLRHPAATPPPALIDVAAAAETLTIMREQNLANRAVQIAELVDEYLLRWEQDISGLSPVKIHAWRAIRLPEPLLQTVVSAALQQGLLLAPRRGEALIPLHYALMIPEEQLYEGLDVLEFVLNKVVN